MTLSRHQRYVIGAILSRRQPSLWTDTGPSANWHLSLASMSPAEQTVAECALAIWEGSDGPTVAALRTLDGRDLEMIGSLLVALAKGPSAVDCWIEKQLASAQQEQCYSVVSALP